MKQIVIINGSGGTGKDSFVELCGKHIPIYNISSVDKVKQAARVLGWKNGKTEKDRKFLSDIKLLSSDYNNQPYTYIKAHIGSFRSDENPYSILFIHVREPENIETIKNDFGCKTLLIKNPNVKGIDTNMADANVENYKYDYTIWNDGTLEDLEMKAVSFISMLNGYC